MSLESVMPSNHLILCRPLLLPPLIFPRVKVFASESVLPIRWPKYWIFSFSITPSNEHSGLISFRMDWLDFLAIGTLKSLLQQEPTFLAISAGDSNKFVHRLHIEKPWCRSLHLRQHFEFLCWIWYTYHCHSYSKLKHLLTFLWAWQCVKFFCIPVHIVLIS